MATSRAQKIENTETLRQDLSEVPHAFLVDFEGLDVAGAIELRRKIREQQASFRVVKNATALRAVEDLPLGKVAEAFVGQTAIAYTAGDVVGLAKVLREFHKEFETPTFKAGIVDGEPISAEQFDQLAQLPARDELIAKVLYLMNYPVSGLVTVLGGLAAGDCWFVGDHPENDVRGAAAFGMTAVWITHSVDGHAWPADAPEPAHRISALSELLPLLGLAALPEVV